jgi:C-terminal processing protease CtpA/Prc
MIARIVFFSSLFVILFGCTACQVRSAEAPNFKLFFIVNRWYDKAVTIGMFRNDDPLGLDNRARVAGVDPAIARKIHDEANPFVVMRLANKLVEDRFKKEGQAIEASKEDLWVQWKNLLPVFSNVVVETTESPWVHPCYICFVSSIFPGLTDWWGNKVGVGFRLSPEYKRRVLAQEILLSDVFQLLRKRYPRSVISDWQVWAFSEITQGFLLDDDPRLKPYWPNFPHARERSYPQLPRLEKSLKGLFDRRTSYVDYEDKAAQVLKGFQPFLVSWLGVFDVDVQGKSTYRRVALDMNLTGVKGVLILGLHRGSPADKAGLMPGDFITAVGSTQIGNAAQFIKVIRSLDPGTKTSVSVLRLGEPLTLSATIGELDIRNAASQNYWPGFTVTKVSEKADASGNVEGVAVAAIIDEKSPAAVAGLKPGDDIKAVNAIRIRTLRDFYKALNANGGRSASLVITREGKEVTLDL